MQKVTDNIYVLVLLGMAGVTVIAIALIFFLLKYQRNMLQQQMKLQEADLLHQKRMLHATIASQEEERKRIGRDLHDEVCGALCNLQLLSARAMLTATASFREINDKFEAIINRARTISYQLSPPGLELFGLYEALEELCDTCRRATSLDIIIINEAAETLQALPFSLMLPLYRMQQELLSNTVKHAAAHAVTIAFYREQGNLLVMYKDDGKGLDINYQQKKGMGMNNIISRSEMMGASFQIGCAGNTGFSILFRIPLEQTQQL